MLNVRNIVVLLLIMSIDLSPLYTQRQMEKLNRGTLAVQVSDGVFISWRVTGSEWRNVSYNIYRGSEKINTAPITGASNYLDLAGSPGSRYHVKAIVNGTELEATDTATVWPASFMDVPVRQIAGEYELNDASVGDLDGDGNYEIVVKRLPPDRSPEPQYTPLLEAYRLDGTWLWTIDLGPNLLNMTQINFVVYDLDGDGKAEVVTKTSEATVDGTGTEIGDVDGDGITNYRPTAIGDDMIDGPEFLSLYEGTTGREVARTTYISREPLSQWGLPGMTLAQLAHRSGNNMMAVIYADGKRPSLVICRGIYHRTKMVALDYRSGTISERWRFDSDEWPPEYTGQGNHNLSVADVDDDGRDEIVYGSMTIDDDGSGLYSTGLGHGDALHVSDMDPDRPGLEVWQAHEASPNWGGTYRDAATGEILIQYTGNRDMGRACAADITADYRGFEMWGATECPMYNCRGTILPPASVPVNHVIWWDGDLLREFLNHDWLGDEAATGIGTISKFNGTGTVPLLAANGTYSINGTKGNPCLQADILGDWREEVIWRTTDNQYLRIYTTVIPTEHRMYTPMHDPQYRIAVAWQNNAYNQPPHPGFFIGHGMDSVPPPPMMAAKLTWHTGNTWDLNTTAGWLYEGSLSTFNNGDDVLFDISGAEGNVILNGSLIPSSITVYSPSDYTWDGPGYLTGTTGLLKAGAGTLTVNTYNDFTGFTAVWGGSLIVNGSLMNSTVNVKRLATAGGCGSFGNGMTVENSSRIRVGGEATGDTLRIFRHLTLLGDVTVAFDLSDDTTGIAKTNDIICINGDLNIAGRNAFMITPRDVHLATGPYTLIQYTGTFTGNVNDIEIIGIPGVPYVLEDTGISLVLRVLSVRAPAAIVWTGVPVADWDLAKSLNWLNKGVPDWFVGNDTVLFNDTGAPNTTVNLTGTLPVGKMTVDASVNYTFTGNGMISGNGGVVKSGTGILTITTLNDYTGSTVINKGVLSVAGLKNGGDASACGAANPAAANLVLNGGTLSLTGNESITNRSITLGEYGGTIDIHTAGYNHRINGQLTGNGRLIKTGSGVLTLGSANIYSGGTLLKNGTIRLASEEANISGFGTGPVTIEYGTIAMLDNSSSYTDNCDWDMIIPENGIAWLNLDARCSLTGSLTGSGTLNLYSPFIRSELSGNWSAFTGTINVTTNSDGGTFLLGNAGGLPGASVNLGDDVSLIYRKTSNVTVDIGEISGTPSSKLGAGGEGSSVITWRIGSKNTNAVFNGIICNDQFKNTGASASIIKTGTGSWTLTGSNTYTGTTTVNAGKLWVNNSTGSGTGTGTVTVNNGAILGGSGTIGGKVIVGAGASLAPGNNSTGTLTVNNDVLLQPGSFLVIEVNTLDKLCDRLAVSGTVTLGGILYITRTGTPPFVAGDSIHILDATRCSGTFDQIVPVTPGEQMLWDTTLFSKTGVVRIVPLTSVNGPGDEKYIIDMYPNPVKSHLTISLPQASGKIAVSIINPSGQIVYGPIYYNVDLVEVDLSSLATGLYFVHVAKDDRQIIRIIMKE